ncbi:MAG: hypothetical protein FWC95_03990 [Defluviitaleaceae bacterium]|nr:hypothetical protein [Defluviitaleaceae bacterium]
MKSETFSITAKILLDVLEKKKAALQTLQNITYNQEFLLFSPMFDETASFFMEMNEKKWEHINIAIKCDEVFAGCWSHMRGFADKYKTRYVNELQKIKGLINEVQGLDLAIRDQEMKNNEICMARRNI